MLVIGHIATRWALERRAHGVSLEELAARAFRWQPGWDYRLASSPTTAGAAVRPWSGEDPA